MPNSLIRVGMPVPRVKLPASTGQSVDLADFVGRKTVVLYFYPKADTPGCTKEACGFRDTLADYDRAQIAVVGISPDPVEAVVKFAAKYHLNFPLLADADHSVAEQFGVWQQKSMAGREYMGVVRTTFVIGRDGKISKIFEKVRPEGHEHEVLQWLKEQGV